MKKVICLAALMLQGIASANLFCGNVWVAGEALLLRPSGAYPYSTIIGPEASNVPEGCQLASCPGYEWGYKVEVGYRCCDKEVLINWLSWNNGYRNRVSFTEDQQAWLTDGSTRFQSSWLGPGLFDARNTFKYDALDAEVAKWMCKECSKFSGRGFFGLRYARLRHSRDNRIFGVFLREKIRSQSDFQGVGPRAGIDARWDLWCGIGLSGSVAGHLLIGSAKSRFLDEQRTEDVFLPFLNVTNRSVCRIIPASEVKFGLDWKGCLFCGFSGELGVGYQITHYFYGDQSTLFTQTGHNAATNHVHTDPISFDGWYFRIGLMY